MDEVRRDEDGELEGFVREGADGGWEALTVFGGVLGRAALERPADTAFQRDPADAPRRPEADPVNDRPDR